MGPSLSRGIEMAKTENRKPKNGSVFRFSRFFGFKIIKLNTTNKTGYEKISLAFSVPFYSLLSSLPLALSFSPNATCDSKGDMALGTLHTAGSNHRGSAFHHLLLLLFSFSFFSFCVALLAYLSIPHHRSANRNRFVA